MRVLMIGNDDTFFGEIMVELDGAGYQPLWYRPCEEALTILGDADLILLDLALLGSEAVTWIRKLRRDSDLPMLVLCADGDQRVILHALGAGADDYVVKPVRPAELVLRIEVVAVRGRRPVGPTLDARVSGAGVGVTQVVLDPEARTVRVDEQPVKLTAKEFEILALLVRNAGRALSRQAIVAQVWNGQDRRQSRTLDVHMTTLRAKLNRPHLIRTIHGYGYRMER